MYPPLMKHLHLAALLIEYHFVRLGAFTAEPHHLLPDVRGKSPGLRVLHLVAENPAGAETLELGSASGIDALPQRRHTHIL